MPQPCHSAPVRAQPGQRLHVSPLLLFRGTLYIDPLHLVRISNDHDELKGSFAHLPFLENQDLLLEKIPLEDIGLLKEKIPQVDINTSTSSRIEMN